MAKNYLLIVEGAVTEKNILMTVFKRYGFMTIDCGGIDLKTNPGDLIVTTLENSGDKVYIVQGPRNRIGDWLKLINTDYDDLERYFNGLHGWFAGIFIIYDVDHTTKDDLETMFKKYADETSTGLLLLSSPCIEVLADKDRKTTLQVAHLRDYKKELNKRFDSDNHCSTKQYILNNFEELILYYLTKNAEDFGSLNVMDHPGLVLAKINEQNDRLNSGKVNQFVCFRYFTTVLYVCIAYIKGMTKEIDNVDSIKAFFQKNQQK